jgi:hypothetical protein
VGSSSCGGFIRLPFPDPTNPGFETVNIPGALYTVITGINELFQITGYYGYTCPALYPPGATRTCKDGFRWKLPFANPPVTFHVGGPYDDTIPTSINNFGAVVGTNVPSNSLIPPQAFCVFCPSDFLFTISDYPLGSAASAINDSGEVAGVIFHTGQTARAFVMPQNGTPITIGPPSGYSWAIGISRTTDSVIGFFYNFEDQLFRAFTQTATGAPVVYSPTVTGTAGRPAVRPTGGGINDNGQAAIENFYIDASGVTPILIPRCTGGVRAEAINADGWVTGNCLRTGEPNEGFLWRKQAN